MHDGASYGHIFEKSIETSGGDLNALKFNADTNWYDELLRTAMMTNHMKVKTIRNFINVVKIGIVLFKYWADRSNLFVYRIPVC